MLFMCYIIVALNVTNLKLRNQYLINEKTKQLVKILGHPTLIFAANCLQL